MTKPTKWLCALQRLPSLIRIFAVPMKKAWVLSYPMSTQRRLIRLGECPGWSESSLGTYSLCWFCHVVAQMYVYGNISDKRILSLDLDSAVVCTVVTRINGHIQAGHIHNIYIHILCKIRSVLGSFSKVMTKIHFSRISRIRYVKNTLSRKLYRNDPKFSDKQCRPRSDCSSHQGLHYLPFRLLIWTHYSIVEPHSSNLRVITTNVLGVRIFRKFTVDHESKRKHN